MTTVKFTLSVVYVLAMAKSASAQRFSVGPPGMAAPAVQQQALVPAPRQQVSTVTQKQVAQQKKGAQQKSADTKKPVSGKKLSSPGAVAAANGAGTLQLDSAGRRGVLPNGFTYYIRRNLEPANRAVFYLVTKAGSVLETDEQQGLAHFAEHMAFKGTKHYPKKSIIDYLQKAGVQFGADLNAFTNFDETVYQLPLPAQDTAIISNGLQILRDWAQEVTMDTEDMETERGVVIEEKRLRKGLQARIQEQTFPSLLNHARYTTRMPIGIEKVLTTFKPETLRRFYKDWYRPNLQALIVVGDVDEAAMEQRVKKMFGTLTNPVNAPARPAYAVELTGKNHFVTVTDAELPNTNIQWITKGKLIGWHTTDDIRRSLTKNLFNTMIEWRMAELLRQSDPPCLEATVSLGNLFTGIISATVTVGAKPGETARGVKAVWHEMERVRQHGFTAAELERVKRAFMQGQEAAHHERSKTPSQYYVNQYLELFLHNQPNVDAVWMYEYFKKAIDGIQLTDVNKWIETFYTTTNRDIYVVAPENEKAALPAESALHQWIQEAAKEKMVMQTEGRYDLPLLAQKPVKGTIVQETINKQLGTTEYLLSNGIRVIVKPTSFKNDQVIFGSYSPGGTSLYSDNDHTAALNAVNVAALGGIGNFDTKTLGTMLTGKVLSIAPYISEYYEGINGQSNQRDLETALQILYLYVTAPRLDTALANSAVMQAKAALSYRYQSPDQVFADTTTAILGGYHYRRQPPTRKTYDQLSVKRAFDIFKERFADCADFTFFFTGSINVDSLKPLLEQYIAALPALYRKEQGHDLGIRIPKGTITKTLYKGQEQKASVTLIYHGTIKTDPDLSVQLGALREILTMRMTERLRNKESGVYTPSVSIGVNQFPDYSYTLQVSFGCGPENVEKLIAAAKEEVRLLTEQGPSEAELQKYKAEASRGMELAMVTNEYWHQSLAAAYQNGDNPADILQVVQRVDKLTTAALQKTASKYFKTDNLVQFVLLPEK